MLLLYTKYENSVLATCMSMAASLLILVGVLMAAADIFHLEEIADEGAFWAGVVFAALGVLLRGAAKRVAVKKAEKMNGGARRRS